MKQKSYPFRILLAALVSLIGTSGLHAQCNPVTSISHIDRRCDSVQISWPAVAGATTYGYAVSQTATPPNFPFPTAATTAEIANLIPSSRYYVHVRTTCGGVSSVWKTDSFMTTACAPGVCIPPASAVLTNITNNSATATWNAFPAAIGYEYIIDQTSATPAGSGTAVTTTTAALTGLFPGAQYFLHLRSKCSATSYSSWGPAVGMFTTGSCTPVSSLQINVPTCDSARFTWPAAPGATRYIYAINQSATPPSAGIASNTNAVNVGQLTGATRYYFHVRANCGGSVSTWISDTFRTPACYVAPSCVAPAAVTVSNITAHAALLSWGTVTGAIGYEYVLNQMATSPAANGTLMTSNSGNFTGLASNTAYYLHVRAKCDATTFSPWKNSDQFRTLQNTSISTNSMNPVTISIYPNPASDAITVALDHQPGNTSRLSVFSIDGRLVKELVPTLKTEIDVRQMQPGIYMVRYTDIDQIRVMRFTKQ
jgi:hypothetical protein